MSLEHHNAGCNFCKFFNKTDHGVKRRFVTRNVCVKVQGDFVCYVSSISVAEGGTASVMCKRCMQRSNGQHLGNQMSQKM